MAANAVPVFMLSGYVVNCCLFATKILYRAYGNLVANPPAGARMQRKPRGLSSCAIQSSYKSERLSI